MNSQGQIYRNTDAEYQEVCQFLDTLSALDPNMLWESGRTNFWRHSVHADKDEAFFCNNVRVWRTDVGEMVALCISEDAGNDLFIEVHPNYHGLYPAILDWAEHTWASRRSLVEVDVFAEDARKIESLVGRGFALSGHVENKRTFDLEQLDVRYQLEEGFSICTFAESGDVESRVALVQSAFANPSYTAERLNGLVASPDHRDEYDLMVLSPDGLPVAYCVGWHETARDGYGYIEPVGTHADFRRRGFASAVIKECFLRLKANGIRYVEIASDAEPNISNFLYDSLYPATKREVHRYGKQVNSS